MVAALELFRRGLNEVEHDVERRDVASLAEDVVSKRLEPAHAHTRVHAAGSFVDGAAGDRRRRCLDNPAPPL